MWIPLVMALVSAFGMQAGEEPELYVPAQRWALVIGAQDYPHLGRLEFARSDAVAFGAALEGRLDFDASRVVLMTDTAEREDLRPTAGNMFLQLRRLLADERLDAGDLFVFYFAGHGVSVNGRDYLLPNDAALETVADVGLDVEQVVAELAGAGLDNVLFIVDGCRSGAANPFGAQLWELAEQANLAVVLSCAPGAQSFEDRRLGGGVFTHFLLTTLDAAEVVDATSGALWASRVAAATRAGVRNWTSRGFEGEQVPWVWNDPTRDVLLGAQLPEDAQELVAAFQGGAGALDREHYLGAIGLYAEALFGAERYAECAELLRAAREVAELSPALLYFLADSLQANGRVAEMTRVQAELVATYPDSYQALTVLAHDFSGETSASARFAASWTLWNEWSIQSEDLALLVAFNLVNGGRSDQAQAVLDELLPKFDPATRGGAYLSYMDHLLHGRVDAAFAVIDAAEALPAGYPGNRRLRFERLGILRQLGQVDAQLATLDQSIRDWPGEGQWWALRARLQFERGAWDAALRDAGEALDRELLPWAILMAVRAAGIDSPALFDKVDAQAERFPNSWKASLARAFCFDDQSGQMQPAIDAAKRLAPRLGTWTAEVAALQYERGVEALERGIIDPGTFEFARGGIMDVLAERAGSFGDEPAGWTQLCTIGTASARYRQVAELIRLHLTDELASGRMAAALIAEIAPALLNAGDHATFSELRAIVPPGTDQAAVLAWLDVAYLVCAGANPAAEAAYAEALDAEPIPVELAPWLAACLRARAGAERADLELETLAVPQSFMLHAIAGLTFEALGDFERAEVHYRPVFSASSEVGFFFARVACWRALAARTTELEVQRGLAWAAGRDGLGVPLAERLSFASAPDRQAAPDVADFVGTTEFVQLGGSGELRLPAGDMLLTVRKGGRVNATLEGPLDEATGEQPIWTLTGSLDAYGNFEGALRGAPRPARVFAKLAPPAVFASEPLLNDTGLVVLVLDEAARQSVWILRPL